MSKDIMKYCSFCGPTYAKAASRLTQTNVSIVICEDCLMQAIIFMHRGDPTKKLLDEIRKEKE